MARYVAFLKAINVGGHVVKMDRLRQLFEAEGLANVETFIASGNVIFDAAAKNGHSLETKIAARLRKALGYDVATFLRTTTEVAAIARYQPFQGVDAKGTSLFIGFLAETPGAAANRAVTALSTKADQFHVHGHELYWLCRGRMSDSDFSYAKLEKALGLEATFRNVTTVAKIADKYAS